MRYEGEQLYPGDRTAPSDAMALLVIGMNLPPEHESDFNEWKHYDATTVYAGPVAAFNFAEHWSCTVTGMCELTDTSDSPRWVVSTALVYAF